MLKSSHVAATFASDQMSGSVAASILQNGDVTGSVTLGPETSNFVYVDRTTYFETNTVFVIPLASGIYSIASRLKGRPWWRTSGTAPAAAVVQLVSDGLSSRLHRPRACPSRSRERHGDGDTDAICLEQWRAAGNVHSHARARKLL
jgi:hypothetical protein